MTLSKGDIVILPQRGLCVVLGRRRVGENSHRVEHLILEVKSDASVVTLPVAQIPKYKLRTPITLDEFDEVLAVLSKRNPRVSTMWSRRFKRNQALLHSGEALEVATVVSDLTTWSRRNILSAAERTMYDRAYANLLGEMKHAAVESDLDVAALMSNALLS